MLCATGKAGTGIAHRSEPRGEAFGSTCSARHGAGLEKLGAKPMSPNCIESRERSPSTQLQGKMMRLVASVFHLSLQCLHHRARHRGHDEAQSAQPQIAALHVEAYLRASGLAHAILRPVAFVSNLNTTPPTAPTNWNLLKPGRIKFITDAPTAAAAPPSSAGSSYTTWTRCAGI